jgi:hypothetical protein
VQEKVENQAKKPGIRGILGVMQCSEGFFGWAARGKKVGFSLADAGQLS